MENNTMIFQKNFQSGDIREENHISCQAYYSTLDMPCPLHSHSYYEISYIFKGERMQQCNGKWYNAKDTSLFFVPPLYIHGYSNITITEDIVIQFTADFLKNISPALIEGKTLDISWDSPYIEIYVDYMEELRDLSISKNTIKQTSGEDINKQKLFQIELRINSLVTKLLSRLLECGYIHFKTSSFDNHDCRMFDAIINDILLHPDDMPDMDTAARKSGLSYYTFSRHFKAATGFNYSEYCNMLRMQHAENLLINTNMPVSEVANAVGITTFSYFSRMFKDMNGMSPSAYRQHNKDIPLYK